MIKKKIQILMTLLKKDFLEGLRNWEVLLVIVMPVLISLIMITAFSNLDVSLPKVGVLSSSKIDKKILPDLLFKEKKYIKSLEEGKKLLDKKKIHALLVIPEGLENLSIEKKDLSKTLKVIIDDSETSKSMMVKTIVEKSLNNYYKLHLPINLAFENYSGVSLKQKLLPTWILLAIFMIGLTLIPKGISSEKEKKTLDALLLTPATEMDFLLSKFLWGFLLMFMNVVILLVLNDGLTGHLLGLSVLLILGIFASAAIGMFIAVMTSTESTASIISTFVLLVMVMSSTIGDISDKAKAFVFYLPSFQLADGFQKTALLNKGFDYISVNLGVLFLWSFVFTLLTFYKLNKKN